MPGDRFGFRDHIILAITIIFINGFNLFLLRIMCHTYRALFAF